MLILAVDTAGPACQVALGRAGPAAPDRDVDILAHRSEPLSRGHAERLLPMIAEVLAEADLAYRNLDAVAVTTGPGSFTGVRIGVAAARGLALALDRRSIGIGTLDALLHRLQRRHATGIALAALDARRGEVFAAARDLRSGRDVVTAAATSPAALASTLTGLGDDMTGPFRLTGSGAELIAAELQGRRVAVVVAAAAPDMRDVLLLAAARSDGPDAGPPVPAYLRDADAKPQGVAVATLAAPA